LSRSSSRSLSGFTIVLIVVSIVVGSDPVLSHAFLSVRSIPDKDRDKDGIDEDRDEDRDEERICAQRFLLNMRHEF